MKRELPFSYGRALLAGVLTAIIAAIVLEIIGCATESDHPIAEAAKLDGEYAIAICGEPTHPTPDGIRAMVVRPLRPYRSVQLRDTGVEHCAVLGEFMLGQVERIRVEFPALGHGIEDLHVYHMPSGTTLASHPGPQHAVFTSVPISPYGTFEFKVIPTQTDEPVVLIGEVKAGHPLLVPIDEAH